ncbi:hypothetical protein LINPERPRIM_LOCUS36800 [Linum perenne]
MSRIIRHIWNIISNNGSLWIAWIDRYMFKGRGLWNCKIVQHSSWI